MKKYETPYGKKSGLLLALAMDSHCREASAVEIIHRMLSLLKEYAPKDATHDGLETCDVIVQANRWLEKRKNTVKNTEDSFSS